MTLGVVTGLAREAAWLAAGARGSIRIACAGADPSRAARLSRELLADGCRALVSFGVAGGLNPSLAAGDLVLADAVTTPDGRRHPTDAAWRRRLAERCRTALRLHEMPLAGTDVPVLASADKDALRRRSGAWAVDMESHAVARAAVEAGVPFLVVRAIADPASRAVPAWLADIVDERGRTRRAVLAATIIRRPGQIAALIRLGRDFAAAGRTLRRVAIDAGPAFAVLGE